MTDHPDGTFEVDDGFYGRADAHIQLSNDQVFGVDSAGKVSASMMFATARFALGRVTGTVTVGLG